MSRLLFFRFATPSGGGGGGTYTPPLSVVAYWGPHYPDVAGGHYWSRHFPDGGQSPLVVGGYGPDGVATLALDIEQGFTVTYEWVTDVIDHRDGTEQRVATLLRPKQSYKGAAKIVGNVQRLQRSRLARYAAQGAVFLLGLPHEALTLQANASGTTITVTAAWLSRADWAQAGQRVVVRSPDLTQSVNAVVQSSSGSSIVLNVAPGAIGARGGQVMPAMAVYLEPQQDFGRFVVNVETWNVAARAAIFDFAPPPASLDLATATGDASLAGAKITARIPGVAGNLITFEMDPFVSNPVGGALAELAGTNTTAQMKGGTDTLAALATLLNTSVNVKLTGTYNPAAVISSGDGFTQDLAGGVAGAFGTGAALTMYAGHPVWDRGIQNDGTITDPSQAQTEIVDLGGVPVSIGMATDSVWGRTVAIERQLGDDWQWLKLFLATVRGKQRMFWLPTYRADFTFVSRITGSITVRTDDGSDIGAWYPSQRQHIQITQANGTITRAAITFASDNGDGTMQLGIGTTISTSPVAMVSWLDPVRFDADSFDVVFNGGSFAMATTARAHTASSGELAEVET